MASYGQVFGWGATSNLTDVTVPTAWTPTDQSGAALTFTAVSGMYTKIGNIVTAYGTLTFPSTANGASSLISLPVAVPNQEYAAVPALIGGGVSAFWFLQTVKNTSTAAFRSVSGAEINSTFSLKQLRFCLIYPAS